jgi:hypothetical protein
MNTHNTGAKDKPARRLKVGAVIYDTGRMSIGGRRDRVAIKRARGGIHVVTDSIYEDRPGQVWFYRDGAYPEMPESPQDWLQYDGRVSRFSRWMRDLEGCAGVRIVECLD